MMTIGAMTSINSSSFRDQQYDNPISNPYQLAFAYYYGHLPLSHPGTMLETGNIADNFHPTAGPGNEYREEDIQLFFNQLEELREARIDGITISIHDIDDVRDDGVDMYINNALPRCDNPFPGIKIKFIVERLANLDENNSDEFMDKLMKHLWENYLNSPSYFRNEDGLPEIEFFTGDNPEWIDNRRIAKQLYRLKETWGINPVMRSYVGSSIRLPFSDVNEHASDLDKFPYGFPPLDLKPDGLEMTNHQATVTTSYSKSGGQGNIARDFKHRVYNPEETEQIIREARASKAKRLGLISYNEGVEDTDFEGDEGKINLLAKELYDPEDDLIHATSPAPCIFPPDSNYSLEETKTGENIIVSFPSPILISRKENS